MTKDAAQQVGANAHPREHPRCKQVGGVGVADGEGGAPCPVCRRGVSPVSPPTLPPDPPGLAIPVPSYSPCPAPSLPCRASSWWPPACRWVACLERYADLQTGGNEPCTPTERWPSTRRRRHRRVAASHRPLSSTLGSECIQNGGIEPVTALGSGPHANRRSLPEASTLAGVQDRRHGASGAAHYHSRRPRGAGVLRSAAAREEEDGPVAQSVSPAEVTRPMTPIAGLLLSPPRLATSSAPLPRTRKEAPLRFIER